MTIFRKIRIILAAFACVVTTGLLLDFTGSIHGLMAWMAKIQFLPAVFALNIGVIVGIILLTLLFGRIYCSIICPLGTFQDLVSRNNRKKNRFRYSPAIIWLRYLFLALFVIAFVMGIGSVLALLEPYSAYSRMVSNMLSPLYRWGNNLLAYLAERADSYAFYHTEVWIRSIAIFSTSLVTLVVIIVLAWRGGRTYCNTICPVGTILGFIARFSIYKHRIDTGKCNGCGLCARNCKASCIDPKTHTIDYSRCVACFNCIDKCSKKAIHYERSSKKLVAVSNDDKLVDPTRRSMLTVAGALVATSVVNAQKKKVDGGLAFIEDKKIPARQTPIIPPGSKTIRNFTTHCTGCQLCVSVCPNHVLCPSTTLTTFMQPEMSYERGYCRPECVKCSEVCPTGAITSITVADKSATQIGRAVWVQKNCVVVTDGVECGNCARHCPTGAITMVEKEANSLDTKMIPVVNVERCIGCGACENLCPSRPFSAIYVEGHTMHRII